MMQPRMRDVIPTERRYKTCAVVGNNGNMIVSNFGKEIDRHEAVIRLNKVRHAAQPCPRLQHSAATECSALLVKALMKRAGMS